MKTIIQNILKFFVFIFLINTTANTFSQSIETNTNIKNNNDKELRRKAWLKKSERLEKMGGTPEPHGEFGIAPKQSFVQTIPSVNEIREREKEFFEKKFNSDEFKAETILKEFKNNLTRSPMFAAQLSSNLQRFHEKMQQIQPIIKNFKLELEMLALLYAERSAKLPKSINDFISSILHLVQKVAKSSNPDDIALIAALQNMIATIVTVVEKLYSNKNDLANALTAQDIDTIKSHIKKNVDNIYNFVGRNSNELDALIKKNSLITYEDENVAKGILQEAVQSDPIIQEKVKIFIA